MVKGRSSLTGTSHSNEQFENTFYISNANPTSVHQIRKLNVDFNLS